MRRHTGEKPYKCKYGGRVCGAAFITKNQLDNHIRAHHTRDRPFNVIDVIGLLNNQATFLYIGVFTQVKSHTHVICVNMPVHRKTI